MASIAPQQFKIDVVSNVPFADDDAKKDALQRYEANTTPTDINIYPKDFAGKDAIKGYLDAYNEGRHLFTIVIDMVVTNLVGVSGIPNLTLFHSGMLILGSVVLTLIASFIPAKMAAKKDPVEALRTE